MYIKIRTIDDQIEDEKLQYDINAEAAKISSDKIDKYEYLTGEEILPSNQKINNRTSQVYLFSFWKSFWKTNKNNLRSRKNNKLIFQRL